MQIYNTDLEEVLVIEPEVFKDSRGLFKETWHQTRYAERGLATPFIQDNLSLSLRGVVRGLHYQQPYAQGKLVSVIEGEIFDVAVDIRQGSPSFGNWVGIVLSSDNHRQLWIPPGYAHGFLVVSERAYVLYKCTECYVPEASKGIRWNDPELAIDWPMKSASLSDKDQRQPFLSEVREKAELPLYGAV